MGNQLNTTKNMKIVINTNQNFGATITVKVAPSETIASLKGKIQAKVGTEQAQQILSHGGKQLQDHFTIAECSISKKSTVVMSHIHGLCVNAGCDQCFTGGLIQ